MRRCLCEAVDRAGHVPVNPGVSTVFAVFAADHTKRSDRESARLANSASVLSSGIALLAPEHRAIYARRNADDVQKANSLSEMRVLFRPLKPEK